MSKAGSAAKVKLSSYDDLFGNAEEKTGSEEQIIRAKLTDLHEFRNHPFRVLDDEKMEETTESISKYGVLVPGIARPRAEGGYEIIAGHRRKRGSERAGKEDMPVIVRNYTDDEATIIMVDSNIQREDILPSEKAKAYAMKYEAMKHQGKKGNGNTLDEVGEAAGESGKTVQRYIWLARLSDELLELVDRKKIGLVQGVDISFLSEDAQQWVLVILEESGPQNSEVRPTPTPARSARECPEAFRFSTNRWWNMHWLLALRQTAVSTSTAVLTGKTISIRITLRTTRFLSFMCPFATTAG